jgi:hypothetical protein
MAPATEQSKSQNAAKLLSLSCLCSEEEVGMQVSLVSVSHPFSRTIAIPPCLPLDIRLTEEGQRIFD